MEAVANPAMSPVRAAGVKVVVLRVAELLAMRAQNAGIASAVTAVSHRRSCVPGQVFDQRRR
jgi:hypothetical protein